MDSVIGNYCAVLTRRGSNVFVFVVRFLATFFLAVITTAAPALAKTPDGQQKLVLVAGKPSHPPRMHEFNAGVQLLAKCLAQGAPNLHVDFVLNGWPPDEKVFDRADAVVFYMDGGPNHEIVKGDGSRISKIEEWERKGVGIGCMHYGVEVEADKAGEQFNRWIGGYYEKDFSCNPIWEPTFTKFPEHPITRGVQPFQIKDEWYFNIHFDHKFDTEETKENLRTSEFVSPALAKNGERTVSKTLFTPILVSAPSDAVRNGPYVWPAGPYPHIQAAKGRKETMMWAIERSDGGRGFGFTGGHFHDNWANDNFRKTILNALVWVAKGEVPKNGVESRVSAADLDANLDPKKK
jgi:type 1 glutamine amidotransferase